MPSWPFPGAWPPSYCKPRPRDGTALAFASPGNDLCSNGRHRNAMKRRILLFPADARERIHKEHPQDDTRSELRSGRTPDTEPGNRVEPAGSHAPSGATICPRGATTARLPGAGRVTPPSTGESKTRSMAAPMPMEKPESQQAMAAMAKCRLSVSGKRSADRVGASAGLPPVPYRRQVAAPG